MVRFCYSEGTPQYGTGVQSGNVWIWGVQLEVGSAATPLEKVDTQQELAICQRFYQTGIFNLSGYTGATGVGYAYLQPLITSMRTTPTLQLVNMQKTNITGEQVTAPWEGGLYIGAQGSTLGTGFIFAGTYLASADI